jgi:tetratricopeptide (TPR) repeat protein
MALPIPTEDFPLLRAFWHYARGEALARAGLPDQALAERASIEELAKAKDIASLSDMGVPAPDMLRIAASVIAARAAQASGDQARAATLFGEAAALQDQLPYMEPPFWHYPVHQSLGAALLAQGRADAAEAAFREALKRSPNNGWAAAGLLRTAEARGDATTADEARRLLERNWFGAEQPELDRL